MIAKLSEPKAQQQPTPAQGQTPSSKSTVKPEPLRAKDLSVMIVSRFPDVKVDWITERRLKVSAPKPEIKDVAAFVCEDLGFDHISAVSGVDWIARNELEVIYFVGSVKEGWADFVVAVSERVPRDNPVVPTLIGVWPGAEYHERETHEMFGINFQGHPDQSHLLLPEDWNDLPPLRKDYVSPGR